MWRDVIKLISIVKTTDAIGDIVEKEAEREVFANKKSIKQSEYYQALSVGLKPELTFQVHSYEYEAEKLLKYNDKPYNIIRTFEKGDFVELICEAVI